MQRLLPPTLVLLLGLAATALHFTLGSAPAPTVLRLVGLPIAVIGLMMSVWGSKRFEEVGTNIKTFDQPEQLVSDGLFRWSRNPMYLGFLILLAGVALGLGSWAGVVAPVIFFVTADRWYIPFEEAQMKQTFCEQYETYTQQVRRWLGRHERLAGPKCHRYQRGHGGLWPPSIDPSRVGTARPSRPGRPSSSAAPVSPGSARPHSDHHHLAAQRLHPQRDR